ncbi:carbonic anhydrase [Ruegeria atlantica]|uniref:carbonic anhydrase n=1 Tax=Ruegeria atlantica TaxID=81569 RepID=UPI00147D9513|nr:carbonic anhydrase [Ruegeria atlantica]
MSANPLLIERNRAFADDFTQHDMPALPKLGTMVLTCIDARVDPAHVLGLELGDAVVFRNNGGRVTTAFIDEVAALALLVAKMTEMPEAKFDIVLMQHTKCGAEFFSNPDLASTLKDKIGVDVSANAITDQKSDLKGDIDRLKAATKLSGTLSVSAVLYDVETGLIEEIAPSRTLSDLRNHV